MEPGMQELVGRLTALDPEASESLKVISYFDALVAGGVGVEALLRGAAALSGAAAGYANGSRRLRIGPEGGRLLASPAPDSSRPVDSPGSGRHLERQEASSRGLVRPAGRDGEVWIERRGTAHANDAMVLERLAIAVGITTARRAGDDASAVEIAVNPHASPDERATALARLRLDAEPALQAVAIRVDATPTADTPSAVIATPHGLARAMLVRPSPFRPSATAVGIGLALAPERLPQSWASALVALRLTSADEPAVDAADLGAFLLLAEAADAAAELHPDAAALARLDARTRRVLDALADADSVRSAASRLGMHHSSVQARAAALAEVLGYDPRTPRGRTRYALARTLLTLATPATS
jgi:DNA-binding NarL/FixJ family response regulator